MRLSLPTLHALFMLVVIATTVAAAPLPKPEPLDPKKPEPAPPAVSKATHNDKPSNDKKPILKKSPTTPAPPAGGSKNVAFDPNLERAKTFHHLDSAVQDHTSAKDSLKQALQNSNRAKDQRQGYQR